MRVFCLLCFYVDVQCVFLGFDDFCLGFWEWFEGATFSVNVWFWMRGIIVEVVRVLCLDCQSSEV